MLLLDFKCPTCFLETEELIKDRKEIVVCPQCGEQMTRIDFAVPHFILKGTGWSRDGYQKGIVDGDVERGRRMAQVKKEVQDARKDGASGVVL